MNGFRFAVVDVETTGGFADDHRVTEIGIAISNGTEILDTYHTLINPQKKIPTHITALTGITNQMVEEAPLFAEKAEEIAAHLQDAVFVAHNVNFDYSFVRNEFARCGISLRNRKLCTARYARSLLKDQNGFSLNKLARRFKVNNEQPHRALSDALTAAEILHQLLVLDKEGLVHKKISKLEREVKLPIYLPPEKFHSIPNVPGVYFMYGAHGKPIYIGKAKNLKQRVAQHFLQSEKARTQAFMQEVIRLETQPTGTELMALLKEDVEIRKHWPKHNRAQKQINMGFHVVPYADQSGVTHLGIKRARIVQDSLISFQSKRAALLWLHNQVDEYKLHPKWCGLGEGWQEFDLPEAEQHNNRVSELREQISSSRSELVVRLNGRNRGEKGFVWMRENRVFALGFAPLEIDWNSAEQLEAHAEEVYPSTRINQLVHTHLLAGVEVDVYAI